MLWKITCITMDKLIKTRKITKKKLQVKQNIKSNTINTNPTTTNINAINKGPPNQSHNRRLLQQQMHIVHHQWM